MTIATIRIKTILGGKEEGNIDNKVCGINYDFLIKFEHLSREEEYLRERLRLQDVIGPR